MDDKEEEKRTFLFLIDWRFDVLIPFAKQVNSKLRNDEQRPEVPSWIKNAINRHGKVKEDTLRTGIAEFLKEAGGTKDSIDSGLIMGITMVQFSKVISAVRLIENDPFMQNVMRGVLRKISASDGGSCADLCLAKLALLANNNKNDHMTSVEPIGPLLLEKDNVHLFRECTISMFSYLLHLACTFPFIDDLFYFYFSGYSS